MNRYEFTMTFSGCGETPEQAWADAVDTIFSDTSFASYKPDEMETKLIEKNIE